MSELDDKLYPELSEQAKAEAVELMNRFVFESCERFKEKMTDFYCDQLLFIETDSWSNFRGQILNGLKDYQNCKASSLYDMKAIRAAMLRENKDEIINDLNQDLLDRIKELEDTIKRLTDTSLTQGF